MGCVRVLDRDHFDRHSFANYHWLEEKHCLIRVYQSIAIDSFESAFVRFICESIEVQTPDMRPIIILISKSIHI